jgi:DNA-binding transcriptional regulator GbsR (MarR family)
LGIGNDDRDREEDRFIESWGAMGVLWGINRSMARIHALLVLQAGPIHLDEVSERLNISRGNASMCLKELRNWGVIQRVHEPGDRRDYYVVEPDMWRMFFRIAVERKKREFDPALAALRHLIAESDEHASGQVRERLSEMEDLLSTADRLLSRLLEDEQKNKSMLGILSSLMPT